MGRKTPRTGATRQERTDIRSIETRERSLLMPAPLPFTPGAAPLDAPPITRWNTVASFAHYIDAQDAMDRLSASQFPVNELEIVGSGLRSVEQVTGPMTTQRAAVGGAAAGGWIGLFVGLLVGLFTTGPAWFGLVLGGLLLGAAWGVALGLTACYLARGHHAFSSLKSIAATRYDIIALDGLADRARSALGGSRLLGDEDDRRIRRGR
jgi:hypothetical protein